MTDTLSYMIKSAAGQMMPSLGGILGKAATHAKETGVEESVLLGARLFPDMFDMCRQAQIATDVIGRGAARVAGSDMPSNPDTETSFAQLISRTERVLAFVNDVSDDALNANEFTELTIPMGGENTMTMTGRQYVSSFVLPNMHFHISQAYGLLRHQGVPLGKRDFLMG